MGLKKGTKLVTPITQNRDRIIERVIKGDKLVDIARDYGYSSGQSISMQLADDEDYQAARVQGLSNRLDKREEEVEQSTDLFTLARSRELLQHARWRCEREAPAVWGRDQRSSQSVNIQLNLDNQALTVATQILTAQAIDSIEDGGEGEGEPSLLGEDAPGID